MARDTVVEAIEGVPVTLMHRARKVLGNYPLKNEITRISYEVFERDGAEDPGTPCLSGDLNVDEAWFDSLQLDAGWTEDRTGYNFRHTFAPNFSGGLVYRAIFTVANTSVQDDPIVFEFTIPVRRVTP